MSDTVQDAGRDFWRAPLATPASESESSASQTLVEACDHCGTEFIVGAGFCHVCGASRGGLTPSVSPSWIRYLTVVFAWTRYLQFHYIKQRLGLPTAALVSLLIGVGCALVAAMVGIVFSANTVLDWQAVQLWRIQWLLAAVAAFLAGILLKRPFEK